MNLMKGLSLRKLDGELWLISTNMLSNCDSEFLKRTLSNFDGRLR